MSNWLIHKSINSSDFIGFGLSMKTTKLRTSSTLKLGSQLMHTHTHTYTNVCNRPNPFIWYTDRFCSEDVFLTFLRFELTMSNATPISHIDSCVKCTAAATNETKIIIAFWINNNSHSSWSTLYSLQHHYLLLSSHLNGHTQSQHYFAVTTRKSRASVSFFYAQMPNNTIRVEWYGLHEILCKWFCTLWLFFCSHTKRKKKWRTSFARFIWQ